MLSMACRAAPKYSSKPGPASFELDEDEVAVHRHVAQRRHAAPRLAGLQPGTFVAGLQRHAHRRAVELVGPGVVRAAEVAAGVAGGVGDELRALVRAAVEEHADGAVGLAHHQQRPAGDVLREVVAGVRHLARVAEVVPGVGEEVAPLEGVDLGAEVDVAVHPVVLDQRADRVACGPCAARRSVRMDEGLRGHSGLGTRPGRRLDGLVVNSLRVKHISPSIPG